jgi:formiminoglutamase
MDSKNHLFQFNLFSSEELNQRYNAREGETKLGERLSSEEDAKYMVLGIEESVGPRANKGKDGAQYGFESFLSKFLNMQSNESLVGDDICVLGKISSNVDNVSPENYSDAVVELDDFVLNILSTKINANQIPIVIGGGHNNAYPLIKYSSVKNNAKLDIINLDAHADYRPLEVRHSGNPFSYAFRDGFIRKYSVLSLHQRYNSQRIIDDLKKDNHEFTFLEEYIDGSRDIKDDIDSYIKNDSNQNIGVELDLDSIERMPSSAFSPSGVSLNEARYYIRKMAKLNKISYLHLPEGAPTNEVEKAVIGKTLAYLVTDFIATHGALKV